VSATVKSVIIWDVLTSSSVEVYRCFGGTYRLHLQVPARDSACLLFVVHFLLSVLYTENRGDAFHRNVGRLLTKYRALQPRRSYSQLYDVKIKLIDKVKLSLCSIK
jgi:hypothetical protein